MENRCFLCFQEEGSEAEGEGARGKERGREGRSEAEGEGARQRGKERGGWEGCREWNELLKLPPRFLFRLFNL
jgi:hypothetical protein